MPGGRPPKPIEMKRRLGNPGKRPLPAVPAIVEVVQDSVPLPAALGPIGRELWRTAWSSAPWLSSTVDRTALEQACALAEQIHDMRQIIAEQGITLTEPIVTPAGHVVGERPVAHPLLKELRSAEKQLQSWLSSLGFDPTSRSRLGLEIAKTQSKLADLIASRQRHQPA